MDQELRDLLKQIIDDPKVRKAREDAFKEKVKEAKNGQEILKLKLKEAQELRSTLRLYVKDQDKRKDLIGIKIRVNGNHIITMQRQLRKIRHEHRI